MEGENVKDALKCAISAIYFDDSSDYATALWQIVQYLGGDDAYNLLEEDSSMAYNKYVNCE